MRPLRLPHVAARIRASNRQVPAVHVSPTPSHVAKRRSRFAAPPRALPASRRRRGATHAGPGCAGSDAASRRSSSLTADTANMLPPVFPAFRLYVIATPTHQLSFSRSMRLRRRGCLPDVLSFRAYHAVSSSAEAPQTIAKQPRFRYAVLPAPGIRQPELAPPPAAARAAGSPPVA
jgi:hypothetical protein